VNLFDLSVCLLSVWVRENAKFQNFIWLRIFDCVFSRYDPGGHLLLLGHSSFVLYVVIYCWMLIVYNKNGIRMCICFYWYVEIWILSKYFYVINRVVLVWNFIQTICIPVPYSYVFTQVLYLDIQIHNHTTSNCNKKCVVCAHLLVTSDAVFEVVEVEKR
jgi:hypothetical protein